MKKIVMIILFFVVILVVGFTSKTNRKIEKSREVVKKNDLVVILNENVTVEVNSEVNINSFVKEIVNGKIINESEVVDTSKLGSKELVLLINNAGEIVEYKFSINIIDTIKPVITYQKELTVYVNNNINLLADVGVTDNSNENLQVFVEGDYSLNKTGKYNLKYVATDSSKNASYEDFGLKVITDPNNRVFTTNRGFKAEVVNGITYIDDILIVNKTYSLPSNYGNGLTSSTLSNFEKMKIDASNLGLNIFIASGYRSYYDQKYIYNNYVRKDGQINADTYSARAGHSEHQSGLSIDLNSISLAFKNTLEGKWVNDNCHLYGFIIRYPEGKNSITGYIYEPWHLRYVGVELATKLYNGGNWITLEEYFGIDSIYR